MQLIKRPKIQLKCPLNRTDCQTVRLTVELVNPANLADNYICQFDLQSFRCVVRFCTLRVLRGVCAIFACKIVRFGKSANKQRTTTTGCMQHGICGMHFYVITRLCSVFQSTKIDRCADRNIC